MVIRIFEIGITNDDRFIEVILSLSQQNLLLKSMGEVQKENYCRLEPCQIATKYPCNRIGMFSV